MFYLFIYLMRMQIFTFNSGLTHAGHGRGPTHDKASSPAAQRNAAVCFVWVCVSVCVWVGGWVGGRVYDLELVLSHPVDFEQRRAIMSALTLARTHGYTHTNTHTLSKVHGRLLDCHQLPRRRRRSGGVGD